MPLSLLSPPGIKVRFFTRVELQPPFFKYWRSFQGGNLHIRDKQVTKKAISLAMLTGSTYFFGDFTFMKRPLLPIAALLLFVSLQLPAASLPSDKTSPTVRAFTGEVTESLCPKNHDDMMKEMKNMRMDKATCERTCIQMGAKYTLYDAASDQVYRFDDQKKIEAFAGQKVRVTGTLKKNTITIQNVEAVN